MAYNGAPSSWITGWTEDGTDLTIPLASLPGLTAGEADGTTGDIRNCALAIVDALAAKFLSLAQADRPSKMTISKNVSYNSTTGQYTQTFTMAFVCEPVDMNVIAES